MGGWSPKSAVNAYLDTINLCKENEEQQDSAGTSEPECNEFISALAAGMCAKLIVEVSSEVSSSTIALAAAARQTGGRLVCIHPEPATETQSERVINKDLGLKEIVDFDVGDPFELLPHYHNIDFSLIDCKTENYPRLLRMIDVNPRKSVVVANNLVDGKNGIGGSLKSVRGKTTVRSIKHPIGKGMEVTLIGRGDEFQMRDWPCSGIGSSGRGGGGGGGGTGSSSRGGGDGEGGTGSSNRGGGGGSGGGTGSSNRGGGGGEGGTGSSNRGGGCSSRGGGGGGGYTPPIDIVCRRVGGTPPMDIVRGRGGGTPPVNTKRGKKSGKSKWVVKFDEESGEEHIFRVPSSV